MKDHLSYSQIQLFKTCSAKWDYQYNKFPDRKDDMWHLTVGSAYHLAIESYYNHKCKEEGIDIFLNTFRQSKLIEWQKEELSTLTTGIKYYYDTILPLYKGIVESVEVKEDFNIEGIPIVFTTRIDLLTKDDRIIDHKTVGNSDPDIETNKQLLIYSYWFYQKYHRMPQKVELHKCHKQTWKGNKPIEIFSTEPNKEDMFKVIEEVKATYQILKAQLYAPSISPLCKYCLFKEDCDKDYGNKLI